MAERIEQLHPSISQSRPEFLVAGDMHMAEVFADSVLLDQVRQASEPITDFMQHQIDELIQGSTLTPQQYRSLYTITETLHAYTNSTASRKLLDDIFTNYYKQTQAGNVASSEVIDLYAPNVKHQRTADESLVAISASFEPLKETVNRRGELSPEHVSHAVTLAETIIEVAREQLILEKYNRHDKKAYPAREHYQRGRDIIDWLDEELGLRGGDVFAPDLDQQLRDRLDTLRLSYWRLVNRTGNPLSISTFQRPNDREEQSWVVQYADYIRNEYMAMQDDTELQARVAYNLMSLIGTDQLSFAGENQGVLQELNQRFLGSTDQPFSQWADRQRWYFHETADTAAIVRMLNTLISQPEFGTLADRVDFIRDFWDENKQLLYGIADRDSEHFEAVANQLVSYIVDYLTPAIEKTKPDFTARTLGALSLDVEIEEPTTDEKVAPTRKFWQRVINVSKDVENEPPGMPQDDRNRVVRDGPGLMLIGVTLLRTLGRSKDAEELFSRTIEDRAYKNPFFDSSPEAFAAFAQAERDLLESAIEMNSKNSILEAYGSLWEQFEVDRKSAVTAQTLAQITVRRMNQCLKGETTGRKQHTLNREQFAVDPDDPAYIGLRRYFDEVIAPMKPGKSRRVADIGAIKQRLIETSSHQVISDPVQTTFESPEDRAKWVRQLPDRDAIDQFQQVFPSEQLPFTEELDPQIRYERNEAALKQAELIVKNLTSALGLSASS